MITPLFLDSTGRLRTVWRFAAYGFAILMIQIALGLAAVLVLILTPMLEWFGHRGGVPEIQGLDLEALTPLLMAITALPTTALTLGLTIAFRRWLDRRTVASMGFVPPERRPIASPTLGFFVGFLPLSLVAMLLWGLGGFTFAGWTNSAMTFILIPAMVLLAFQEEIVFRSYLYQNLLDIDRPVFALLFTSVMFWIVHGYNPNAWTSPLIGVNFFGAGILLALAYRASGNIWFPSTLHFGWNFAQGLAFGLPVSGLDVDGIINLESTGRLSDWLTGGVFGLEASILVTLLELLLIAVFAEAIRRRSSRSVVATRIDETWEGEAPAEPR